MLKRPHLYAALACDLRRFKKRSEGVGKSPERKILVTIAMVTVLVAMLQGVFYTCQILSPALAKNPVTRNCVSLLFTKC